MQQRAPLPVLVAAGLLTACGGDSGAPTTAEALLPDQVADHLAFTVQPTETFVGISITPAVEVAIKDALGVDVADATDAVTVAIGANPGGGTLSGTTTVNAVNGIATFSDLALARIGFGYTLVASSMGLTNATSSKFNIFVP